MKTNSQNGKGSKPRPYKVKKYQNNYEVIFGERRPSWVKADLLTMKGMRFLLPSTLDTPKKAIFDPARP